MGSPRDRVSMRYNVRLALRYTSAHEYVQEYAENLSAGGLFIPGAHNLSIRQEVTVELSLPGAGGFKLRCEVAHILDPATAAKLDRRPGAGLAVKRAPKGFSDALTAYLMRLGNRADAVLLVQEEQLAAALAEAGYQVQPCPPADRLAEIVARSDGRVVAIVIPPDQALDYRSVCHRLGAGDMVIEASGVGSLDELLAQLDDEL